MGMSHSSRKDRPHGRVALVAALTLFTSLAARAPARQVQVIPTPDAPLPPPRGTFSPAERKFADAMVAALNARDGAKAAELLSFKDIANRATATLSALPEEIEEVKKVVTDDKDERLFSDIYGPPDSGVKFSILSIETVNAERNLTLRAMSSSSVDYVVLAIPSSGADLKALDVRSPAFGDWISEFYRVFFLLEIQSFHNGAVESGNVIEVLKGFDGDHYQAALENYDKLPDAAKKSKWVQRVRVWAAAHLEPAALIPVAEDANKLFPNDPEWLTNLERAYYAEKKWPELIKTLEALDSIYHDPAIANLKAQVALDSGDSELATKIAKEILTKDPKNRKMLDLLLDAALESEKWADVPAVIDQWEKGTGESAYEMVRKDEKFKPFRRTPEGKAWIIEKKKSQAK